MSSTQNYLVVHQAGVVVDTSDGTSTFYPANSVFSANSRDPSVTNLISKGYIIPTDQQPGIPGSGTGGGSTIIGPPGPMGSPGPPGGSGAPGVAGIVWRGVWNVLTAYVIDDGIFYQGNSYVAISPSTGSTPPSGAWSIIAQAGSPVWKGVWSSSITYNVNEAISFGGSSYVAVNTNLNSPPPNANWTTLAAAGSTGPAGAAGPPGSQGSTGSPGTTGSPGPSGSAGSPGSSGSPGPTGLTGSQGMVWRGPWQSLVSYGINDAVSNIGDSFIAIHNNLNDPPPSLNWQLVAQSGATGPTGPTGPPGIQGAPGPSGSGGSSFVWRGAWSFSLAYAIQDVVEYLSDGNTYIAVANNTGITPPSTGIWELFTSRGAQGPQGVQGVSGGPTGSQGVMGNQGNAGPAGATSNAGYRQAQLAPINISGAQSFLVSTASTPIATDRVYLVVNGQECRTPLFFTVTIVVGTSFTVNWLGAFDLSPNDDVIVAWFTTPP